MIKHGLLLLFLVVTACKPTQDHEKLDLKDNRSWVLHDFLEDTNFPELKDDDVANGGVNYMFYKEDDFVTFSIYGIDDREKIDAIVEEVKSIRNERNIGQYLVVQIFSKATRTSENSISMSHSDLIEEYEIK